MLSVSWGSEAGVAVLMLAPGAAATLLGADSLVYPAALGKNSTRQFYLVFTRLHFNYSFI